MERSGELINATCRLFLLNVPTSLAGAMGVLDFLPLSVLRIASLGKNPCHCFRLLL